MSGQVESLPRELGAYELIARLAAGGMGTVYLGRTRNRLGFVKPVAVKILHPHLVHDADLVLRFLDEARLASKIQHPNVVQVLDVDHVHDSVFMVIEYVHGASLANVLEDRAKPPVDVLATIAHDVLEGLAAAHETKDETGRLLGIVHRDISPQNILVSVRGCSYVADFGIAKAVDSFGVTKSNEILGKLGYMSPEQAFGERVGPRSDLFSFGAVLWEALAGVRLVTTISEQASLTTDRVRELATLAPQADPRLVAFVEKLLAHSPDARPKSAREAAKELLTIVTPASSEAVAEWLRVAAASRLEQLDTMLRGNMQSSGRGEALELAWKLKAKSSPSMTPSAAPAAPIASSTGANPDATETVQRRSSGDVALPSTPVITDTVVLRNGGAARIDVPPATRHGGPTKALLALGLVGVCLAGGGFFVLRSHRTAQLTHALPDVSDAGAIPEVAALTSSVEAPSPAAPLPLPASASAISSSPRVASRAPRDGGTRTTNARPATSCNPPFTYDAFGTKRYIPGCFREDQK